MGSYSVNDFSETLVVLDIPLKNVLKVIAAWGEIGDWAEWKGGFVLQTTTDYVYISGWCDTSGWGCQDGTDISHFTTSPTLTELEHNKEWDINPKDVNKWLFDTKNGKKVRY